jgi:hypothetical protein
MPLHTYCVCLSAPAPAKGLEVQVHHLISLGGWNDVIHLSIYQISPGPEIVNERIMAKCDAS